MADLKDIGEDIVNAIEDLGEKFGAAPVVRNVLPEAPAPVVNVVTPEQMPPAVKVEPSVILQTEEPRGFSVEIEDRDSAGYIKRMTIKPL